MESILERRLQTLVQRKGLAKSMYQARQLIMHGHIALGDQKVSSPSFLVPSRKENSISYASRSLLNNPEHPIRQAIEPRVNGAETNE
jgi:small subunit ribosomal protein S4